MRESDTNTNDSKKLDSLNVIAERKSAMDPWKKKLICLGRLKL